MGNLNAFCKDGADNPSEGGTALTTYSGSMNEFWNAGGDNSGLGFDHKRLYDGLIMYLGGDAPNVCNNYSDEQCASGGLMGVCGCWMFETMFDFDECGPGWTDTYSVDIHSHHGPGLFCGVTGGFDNPDSNTKFHPRWRQQAFFISVAENMCTGIPEGQQRIHDFAYMGHSFESDDFICEGSGNFQPFLMPDALTPGGGGGVTSCYWRAWTYMGYPENDRSAMNDFDENGPTPESIKAAISPGTFVDTVVFASALLGMAKFNPTFYMAVFAISLQTPIRWRYHQIVPKRNVGGIF